MALHAPIDLHFLGQRRVLICFLDLLLDNGLECNAKNTRQRGAAGPP